MRDTKGEKLLRLAFWGCLATFAVYGIYTLSRHHHAGLAALGAVVLIVGSIAVAERPRSR